MKFPSTWPPPLTGVTNAPEVLEPGAVNPVRPAADALHAPPQRYRPVAPRHESAPKVPPTISAERRREMRRSEERRKVQLPVLLDTRIGQDRRNERRREQDEPPSGIDIKA